MNYNKVKTIELLKGERCELCISAAVLEKEENILPMNYCFEKRSTVYLDDVCKFFKRR
jgi:hypothetical protein